MRWLLLVSLVLARCSGAEELRMLTWNVLAEAERSPERTPALLEAILASQPDIICLQEVAPWFLDQLERDRRFLPWRKAVFADRVRAPGGCFLLSRWPMTCQVAMIPSRQDRVAVIGDIDHPSGLIRVAVVHLDSPLGESWQEVRRMQITKTLEHLATASSALFVGDMNFGDGEPEGAAVDPSFTDVWPAVRPGEPGLTWDKEGNRMAQEGSFPAEGSRRLDRIFLRSPGWRPVSAELVGTREIRAGLHPSDHYGVLARLRWVPLAVAPGP